MINQKILMIEDSMQLWKIHKENWLSNNNIKKI